MRHNLTDLTAELTRALKDRNATFSPTAQDLFKANLSPLLRLRQARASWNSIASLFLTVGVPVTAATLKNYGARYLKDNDLYPPIESDQAADAFSERRTKFSKSIASKGCLVAPEKFDRKAILAALAPSIQGAVESGRSVAQIASELNCVGIKVAPITIWRLLKKQKENHD